jgi:hypothetical protein
VSLSPPLAFLFRVPSCRGKAVGTACDRIDDGPGHGAPDQIARRLPIDFPDDTTMRLSHEAIDQALFIQGWGAAPGTHGLFANRAGIADAAGTCTPARQGVRHAGDYDQSAPC